MRKQFVLMFLALSVLACSNQNVQAQDAEVATEAAAKVTEVGASLVSKIQAAFNGDTKAGRELMNDFLVPAAMALILLIVGYLIASFVGRMIGNTVTRRIDKTIGRFAGKMVQNSIMALVILGALGYFGIDVTSFAAILAAAGFAVGMALQGTLSNFAAGVMLLVFRPFHVDDYIKIGDVEGTVEEIDLFTTKLNTLDNRHVIIPNGNIFGETMENYTHNSARRADIDVGVAYESDTRTTRRILEDAISSIPGSLNTPSPQVVLVSLGDSAVNWQCRVWCSPNEYFPVKEQATEAVKNALDRAGISIPYPQMDIHVAGKLFAKAA